MRFFISSIFLFLSPIFLTSLQATEIKLEVIEKQLIADLSDITYPSEIFAQELQSGLPNVIDILLKISDKNGLLQQKTQSFVITYDLWDENYLVLHQTSGREKKLIFRDISTLMLFLSHISEPQLLKDIKETQENEFIVYLQIFFNPVQSERIIKIKNWIKDSYADVNQIQPATPINREQQNHTNNLPEITSNPGVIISNGPRFQKLFDKILEEYMAEDTIAAQWKSKPLTKSFTLKDLKPVN